MQVDDPPFLSVGTAVSAKYKGAFCEAKISKVEHIVKCKVTYKMGLGSATILDNDIKGPLRVGQIVQAKHPDRKEMMEATITKIQDCSMYTVVFDDGDITTLRRSALCLKSGRHFNESETLDQLPLTHPEHFGNPVVGGRRGRRNRQLKEDSSDEEIEEENEPDLEGYSQDIGRVISVESTEKKRGKENWFPGLIVIPSAQPTVKINVKDEFLVRSFKDGRYYTVPKKEVSEFNRDVVDRIESAVLLEAVQKANKFLDDNELPLHWEKSSLFNHFDSDTDDNFTDSSDEEQSEEKDRFVAQLYKFMDDSGTPLNKTPTIATKDIDLHRLFRIVQKMGGCNRVTNQNKWRSVTNRMKLPSNQNTSNQVKAVYKKCLASYETFNRTLGVTMFNPTRTKKPNSKGRSLIRDKDRSTPNQSPKPDKDEEEEKKEEKEKEVKVEPKAKKKIESKEESLKVDSNSDTTDLSESVSITSTRPKRTETKSYKKTKGSQVDKPKVVEKVEETKPEEEKGQQTRSKSQFTPKPKESVPLQKKEEPKKETAPKTPKPAKKPQPTSSEDEKKRSARKRSVTEEKTEPQPTVISASIGDKLKVYYGPTNESKVTYEAKVIEIDKDQSGPVYLVHYTGWNTRYDEWIPAVRIAENLSTTPKSKRAKSIAPTASASKQKVTGVKRGRGASVSGKASTEPPTRSTTPSSVTSTSSRTKSPATPATTRASRLNAKQDTTKKLRRVSSVQTDNSTQSDSDSEISESEPELTRTRSGSKVEEPELRTYRRKIPAKQASPKTDKKKESKEDTEDTVKDEDEKPSLRKTRKVKKSPEKSTEESDDDNTNPPKGRDFDLNQIRSELKGFTKALKVPVENMDKEIVTSSDDSTNPAIIEKQEEKEETIEEEPSIEKSSSSEDIYEFKEPEPFEFETRAKLVDDKNIKKRLPRIFEEIEKSPKKKIIKSPSSGTESIGSPGPEKKTYCRSPLMKQEGSDDEVEEKKDPFDKLVESPSFKLGQPTLIVTPTAVSATVETVVESKPKLERSSIEEPVSLFENLSEGGEDSMELSDCESQTQIFTRTQDLFPTTFSKPSPDRYTVDMEFSSGKTDEGKTTNSDDDDMIRAQIQRAIASSSTDDESNDALVITPPTLSYLPKKDDLKPLTSILGILPSTIIDSVNKEENKIEPEIKEASTSVAEKPLGPIDPALQETDSSVLESLVAKPPMILNQNLDETVKELSVKTGTKIADSILQKFKSIKDQSKVTTKPSKKDAAKSPKRDMTISRAKSPKNEVTVNVDMEIRPELKEMAKIMEKETILFKEDTKLKVEEKVKTEAIKPMSPISIKNDQTGAELKKRRRVVSKPYIDDSDSDSSDSEQLVIARSDDDSQAATSFDKPIISKEIENSDISLQATNDSQSQQSQLGVETSFKFDELKKEDIGEKGVESETINEKQAENIKEDVKEESVDVDDIKEELEPSKEEEEDPALHSMLLCEEEIPRSPGPVTETPVIVEMKPTKCEMPFASAPANSKSLLETTKKATPSVAPPLLATLEKLESRTEQAQQQQAAASVINSPPSTPESMGDNFSPRRDNAGGVSPNDSTKSNESETEYPLHRRNSTIKVSPYSEEDTQMASEPPPKKSKEDTGTPCRKRRRSVRGNEEVPLKRGRKPLNRSRHNSDSDDNSEHSMMSNMNNTSTADRVNKTPRSPRPSKYNFYVEFDPSLDSSQRIAILLQKISELRKTYADVKAELAVVERRRKKIRRREREALKAAKQEVACA